MKTKRSSKEIVNKKFVKIEKQQKFNLTFGICKLVSKKKLYKMAGRGVDLKKEDEVKEYLENLGIEYRFGCYYEKSPVCKSIGFFLLWVLLLLIFSFPMTLACHLLGDYMEAVKQDPEKAFRIYDTNCHVYNHGHSCHKAASAKMRGKGTLRSMVGTLRLYSTSSRFKLFWFFVRTKRTATIQRVAVKVMFALVYMLVF